MAEKGQEERTVEISKEVVVHTMHCGLVPQTGRVMWGSGWGRDAEGKGQNVSEGVR